MLTAVPLGSSSSGRHVEVSLCDDCFRACFVPLLTGGPSPARAATAPPTVLVVDDDLSIRRLLGLALESEGFHVATAANGQEALAKVRDASPQAIVLDLRMPVMSGRDFLRVFRETAQTRTIPILAISAYDVDTTATELGVDAFLAKPVELHALIGMVSSLIASAA
jgi:CheY-like chemotaxis protein